jgi:hypothetical protein
MDVLSKLLFGAFRALWFLLLESILWSIGWVALRIVTLGRYPTVGLSEECDIPYWKTLLVSLVGFGIVAGVIFWLTGWGPNLKELRLIWS